MYINTKNKYINLSAEDLKDLLKRLENEPRSEKSKERTREIISTFNLDNEFFIDNFIKTHFIKGIEYSQTAIEEAFNKFRKNVREQLVYERRDYLMCIRYYTECGWSIQDAREKIKKYASNCNLKGEVLFDKRDIKNYIMDKNPFGMNLENTDFINKFISDNCDFQFAITTHRLYTIFTKFVNDNYYASFGKSSSDKKGVMTIHKEFYMGRGFSEEESIKLVSDKQKIRSARTVEHYMNKGMTEDEAKIARSKTQQSYSHMSRGCKVFWIRRGYDEETAKQKAYEFNYNNSVWAVQYWINKGMSYDDAYQEMLKYNWGSQFCKCYNGDYELYRSEIEKAMHNRILNSRINANKNIEEYKEMFKNVSVFTMSKIEKRCFDMLINDIDDSIIHEPYIVILPVGFKSSCNNANYYACDGYIDYNGKAIIIEYDSGVFHDKEKDEMRDTDIFFIDENVLGILRITEKFFLSINKGNKDEKYKEIKNAIEDIKSARRYRIIL